MSPIRIEQTRVDEACRFFLVGQFLGSRDFVLHQFLVQGPIIVFFDFLFMGVQEREIIAQDELIVGVGLQVAVFETLYLLVTHALVLDIKQNQWRLLDGVVPQGGLHAIHVSDLGLQHGVIVVIGTGLEFGRTVQAPVLNGKLLVDGAIHLIVEHGVWRHEREREFRHITILDHQFLIGEDVKHITHFKSRNCQLVTHVTTLLAFAGDGILFTVHVDDSAIGFDDSHA